MKRRMFKNNNNTVRELTMMTAKEEVAEAVEASEEVAVASEVVIEVAIDLKPKVGVAEEERIEIEMIIKRKKMKVMLTLKPFIISKVEEITKKRI